VADTCRDDEADETVHKNYSDTGVPWTLDVGDGIAYGTIWRCQCGATTANKADGKRDYT
jgi:hypothetical protein